MFRKLFITLLVGLMVIIQPLSTWAKTPTEGAVNAAQPEDSFPQDDPESEDAGISEETGNIITTEGPSPTHTIYLQSRQFEPQATDRAVLDNLVNTGKERAHILVQLDFIPRERAKAELEAAGLKLLAYVPDYAWIASAPTAEAASILQLPGLVWAGELTVEDKLDGAIINNSWGTHNMTPDGNTVAVYVIFHKDENLETGRALVAAHGGTVTGEAYGVNLLMVEMPKSSLRALSAEDAVQWIEPAAPPLSGTNDGLRAQIGVNNVNAAPYNLNGSGIDVLIYDSGQVGNHVDTVGRLIHGDGDTVSEHSTHVAGTVGGSGANSINQGGTALQWRGMAPSVDLISYGTGWTTGIIFYQDVGDIVADFAAAQNTYGADMGTASLGSNVYWNGYDCNIMGKYGASSVLIDQIVRGGNGTVGIGDKYITTWAAGNERNQSGSCSNTYNSTAPPANAKNPIHVGASNTNNNSMTSFSSWGPTQDGRIKPIVVAGGCQTSGDYGIKSTDNSPVDSYTTMCGTSMATPGVAGGIALMLQHYRNVYTTSGNFWPSTAKAILMQTADDFGNTGPDYQWGFGQVDIHAAVDLITRRAFRQESIAQGEVDVFSVVVPEGTNPFSISLAWDDFEATLNANPTLINNLDLELVDPDGTTWRPWVLNPASPASLATRGVDNRNNQEQVQVPTPVPGTWLVRVKGTTIPQGPQSYSLACEGCKPVNFGVCQSVVSGVAPAAVEALMAGSKPEANLEEGAAPEFINFQPVLTAGERWQQGLEAEETSAEIEIRTGLAALEKARETGPEAVFALLDSLTGPALDMAMDEIQAAHLVLHEAAAPLPETEPVSEAEEKANNENQAAESRENRTRTLLLSNDTAEGKGGEALPSNVTLPEALNADRTVGSGCTYPTIPAAITAANPGDRLLIEGGVTFIGNLLVNKNLTLEGGYAGCASGSTSRTTLNGNASGSVITINPGLVVTLKNLNLTNGYSTVEGGGIRFALSPGSGTLTLDNVQVYGNTSQWGGGLWVGSNAEVNGNNVGIYNNTATAYGGGVRLFGGRATFQNSNIYGNSAPYGGGVYGTLESTYAPALNLPTSADIYDNQALTGSGFGGGIYLRQGSVSLANGSDLYSNDAIDGGGAYLVTTTLTIASSSSEILFNTATGNGGGVYAQGSTINLDEDAELYGNAAGSDGSGSGGGAYLNDSSLSGDKAMINYNSAAYYGGGVAAYNGSIIDMDLGSYPCITTRCSRIYGNTATNYYGGGIYANDSAVFLDNTFIEANAAYYGGGVYVFMDSLSASSNVFARNNASANLGDAIRLISSASMSGSGNTLAYNDTGGASSGYAIASSTSSLSLGCSVIWGHTTSISPAGLNVTYSDIQGGYAGTGNINTNPLFVASGSYDYHLQGSSPLIDRCLTGPSTDFENDKRPIVIETGASPYDMGADEFAGGVRVGINGACTYPTIQQAVNAATNGDTIRVAAGAYFENVDILNKSITIAGDYDSNCTATGGGTTRIEGSLGSGSTLDIYGSTATLRSLEVAWGNDQFGGGIDAQIASVILDNAHVHDNHSTYGGGIYVDFNSVINLINESTLYNNTATQPGGGARVWGQFNGTNSVFSTYLNCAPNGGGFYVPGGTLNLVGAGLAVNQAADLSSRGGGIYASNGATIQLSGMTYIGGNSADSYGGGIYLETGSTLNASETIIGFPFFVAFSNFADYGAGIYADSSTVDFNGTIDLNVADISGAGLYATNSSVTLTDALVGGNTESYQGNQLGPDGHTGVGIYLDNGTQAVLDHTAVVSNTFQTTIGYTFGGGIYANAGSTLTMVNSSRVEDHFAQSAPGRGAGIYASDSTVTLDNSQVVSNTAGATGGGIRLYNTSTLNLLNGASLSYNRSISGEGGAVAATGAPDINIIDGTFQYNRAGTDGGAIHLSAGTLDLNGRWDLRWNRAEINGGAVAVLGTGDADFSASSGTSYLAVNSAGGNGGALYIANTDTVQLYATNGYQLRLNTNNATGNGGAAFAGSGGYFDMWGDVQATSNIAGGNGGVFYLAGGSKVWIDDFNYVIPTLWVNQADNGGAIYAIASPQVRCDGAVFGANANGNQATAGMGGAIYLDSSTLTAYNCVFQNSYATGNGGAIAATNVSSIVVDSYALSPSPVGLAEEAGRDSQAPESITTTACDPAFGECSSFHDNQASGNGGAIYLMNSGMNLSYTYLHHNSGVLGGAIYQTGASSVSQVSNSLVHNNTSSGGAGAGIRPFQGSFSLYHVTLADNTGAAGYSADPGVTNEVDNSIAWGNSGGGFSGIFTSSTCNIDQSGVVGSNTNPLFFDSASENYRLSFNSPAIDACASGLTPDLDNHPRPFGSNYDMGAYELIIYTDFLPIILR